MRTYGPAYKYRTLNQHKQRRDHASTMRQSLTAAVVGVRQHAVAVLKAARILISLVFAFPVGAHSQHLGNQIDATIASPDMYEVLLENEHVRVVRYRIGPGERDQLHTHPAKVSYIVSGGTLRITLASGESFIVEEDTDSATWLGAIGSHYAENIGMTAVQIVLVEIKFVDGESNGDSDE